MRLPDQDDNRLRGTFLKSPEPGRIITLRKLAQLTQDQAAAFCHTSRRTWQAWESNESQMPAVVWDWFKLNAPRVGTLCGIQEVMSGKVWSGDTLDAISDLMTRAGFSILGVSDDQVDGLPLPNAIAANWEAAP